METKSQLWYDSYPSLFISVLEQLKNISILCISIFFNNHKILYLDDIFTLFYFYFLIQIATHLKVLLANAQLEDRVSLCIVQTAYANGSSTSFIENTMVSTEILL